MKQTPGARWNREPMLIHAFFLLFSLLCLFPMLLVIAVSFTAEETLIKEGFHLIPKALSTDAYRMIFEAPDTILGAYGVSLITTLVGTALHLLLTSMMAFAISRPHFRLRRVLSFYIFFTMLFGGGLVPYYILMTRYLHLKDNIWAMIVPFMFGAYHCFMLRTNFQSLPASIAESAKMDGSSEFRIFWQLVLPLSTPVVATVGLFIGMGIWNDWFTCMLFINKPRLYSLQMMLQSMMASMQSVKSDMNSAFVQDMISSRKVPTESLRMAMCLVATGPIILLFPFLQKFFVQGLTVGSVKG
mgnify:CR=1 FL=1